MQNLIDIIENGAKSAMTIEQIVNKEITDWLRSQERTWMLVGDRYYAGSQDILKRKRTSIGEGGVEVEVKNLANNRLVHGFVRKLVDQKVGYLLSKPISVQTDNNSYRDLLNTFFDKKFMRLLMNTGKEAVNKGKAWLHVYYDEDGQLHFKKIPSEQIIPFWRDADHTELDAVVRVYQVTVYSGSEEQTVTKVEFWDNNGVRRYEKTQDGLIPDIEFGVESSHFTITVNGAETPYNWERIPFICFKYNEEEISLVQMVKSLVDDYDFKKSDSANNLEDLPNSIYVIKNYDGTDLGEFRRNMTTYRAVKVTEDGGVDTLSLDINVEAFKTHMDMMRKDIYEFGRGVDTQSQNFGNSPSGIALKFLYADLDLDANILETEFQASLEQLGWFIDQHLSNTGNGDFSNESVEFIFNRSIVINENDAISNVKNSMGIVSEQTLLAHHPFVNDTSAELEQIKAEASQNQSGFGTLGNP
jgi:SPP1 family phage portal protein